MYKDTIDLQTRTFDINLHLSSLISIAISNISKDQSYICRLLEALQNTTRSSVYSTNINLDDIIVCRTKNDVNLMLHNKDMIKGKTIFIDRYDYVHSSELKQFILSGCNRVIIMSHTFYDELGLNAESFIIIQYNKEKRLFYTEKLLNLP